MADYDYQWNLETKSTFPERCALRSVCNRRKQPWSTQANSVLTLWRIKATELGDLGWIPAVGVAGQYLRNCPPYGPPVKNPVPGPRVCGRAHVCPWCWARKHAGDTSMALAKASVVKEGATVLLRYKPPASTQPFDAVRVFSEIEYLFARLKKCLRHADGAAAHYFVIPNKESWSYQIRAIARMSEVIGTPSGFEVKIVRNPVAAIAAYAEYPWRLITAPAAEVLEKVCHRPSGQTSFRSGLFHANGRRSVIGVKKSDPETQE
jgi:hypothetical protein